MFERIKALCDSFLNMGVPGFDLMICKDGECILRHSGGYSDIEKKIPVQGDELYNIYSCSKLITCVAAMQLWEKGLFRLEDRLCDYMPEFAEMTVRTPDGVVKAEKPIYIYDLFQMTAGFDYELNSPSLTQLYKETDGRCPTVEVARALAKEPLQFQPGEQFLYSLCHDVLAALVEIWSGEKFEDYVKKHIFAPLGMTRSDFLLPMEKYAQVAPLYRYALQGIIPEPAGQKPVYRLGTEHASGGAGCVSTVEDYMKFLEAVRTGEKLLKRETVKLMMTPRLNDRQMETYSKKDTHGFGLGVRAPREDCWHRDFGWGGAAGAWYSVDMERGYSIFYVQHVLASLNNVERQLIYEFLVEELTGEKCPQSMLGDISLTY